MSEVGLRQELPSLAHSVVIGTGRDGARESVGLLAGVLSGHTGLANDALLQAGMPALAAAHAAAHHLPQVAHVQAGWAAALVRAAAGMVAPGAAGEGLPHFEVVSPPVAAV